jgi:DNA-binding transcriptional LysR family regulator
MFNNKETNDFLIVSQFLNFSKASDYLGVQQSGLSKSVKKLETKLGEALFIRKSHGLDLTEVGRIYKKYVIRSNKEWEMAIQDISSLKNDIVGSFTIGCHPIIGKFFIPKLKKKLEKYPSIKLNFDFSSSRKSTEKVIQNDLDMAIVASPIEYPDLVIRKLWKEQIGLYSKDGKLKSEIIYNNNMLNAKKLLSLYPDISHQRIDDYNIICSTLKRNNSMGFLPNPIADSESKLKAIKLFKPEVDICLVYRSDRFSSQAFKVLTGLLKGLNY